MAGLFLSKKLYDINASFQKFTFYRNILTYQIIDFNVTLMLLISPLQLIYDWKSYR